MNNYLSTGLLATAACVLGPASTAPAQVVSAMIREGGPLPGAPPGFTIQGISTPTVNHVGGYAWYVQAHIGSPTVGHIWGSATGGPGGVLRIAGVVGGYTQMNIGAYPALSDTGAVAYYAGVQPGGLDALWLDDTLIAVRGDPHPSLAGMFWLSPSRPGITTAGIPYFSATVTGDDMFFGHRWLFYGPSGATVLLSGGQALPGLPRVLDTYQTVWSHGFSADGSKYIAQVQMVPPTEDDRVMTINGAGLVINGGLVQENALVTATGSSSSERWQSFSRMGITDSGQYFFTGRTTISMVNFNDVLVKNGHVAFRQSMTIDGQLLGGDVGVAAMNEDGDIAHVWTGPVEALFLNHDLLIKEGDLVDFDNDGVVEPNSVLRSFEHSATLGVSDREPDRTVRVYFTGRVDINNTPTILTDDPDGAFVVSAIVPVCTIDIVANGMVDVNDLLAVINGWGACPLPCPPSCAADVAGPDCQVNVNDLLAVINAWGACP